MNLEQMRARLAAIVAKLDEYKTVASYSQEDVDSINALSEEFEQLKVQIETAEKVEAMTAKASAPAGRKVEPLAKVEVGQNRQALDPKAGFKHSGEFFRAIVSAASGKVDQRLLAAGHQEKVWRYRRPAGGREPHQCHCQRPGGALCGQHLAQWLQGPGGLPFQTGVHSVPEGHS